MDQLTFRVVPDEDDIWNVQVEIQSDGFSGRGWCWVGPASLKKFASELKVYPLPSRAPPTLRLGYNNLEGEDLRIHVVVRQVDPVGSLEARVEIANDDDPSCRVKAKLRTSYAALDRFVPQLQSLAAGKSEEAVLFSD